MGGKLPLAFFVATPPRGQVGPQLFVFLSVLHYMGVIYGTIMELGSSDLGTTKGNWQGPESTGETAER